MGFGKFWVRYRKRFDGSRSLVFFLKFLLLGVLNVFADAPLGVSDLSFYLSIWSSGVNFSGFIGTAYGTELVDYKPVKQDRKPLHCSVVATFD